MKAPASPSVSPSEVDLDSTAELPVLDPAEIEEKLGESAGAAHTASDTWILPAGARVAPPRLAEAPAPPPRMAGAPPASKGGTPGGAEVRELQANLHTALAKLRDAEGLAARQAEQLRDLEASRAEALEARRAAEESAAALRAELTRREAHAAQRLEQHHAVSSGELARERERLQALTAQAQAHSARLIQDLHLERARSASCLEALQTLESRRQIAESATLELQRQMDSRQGAETELRGRLAGGNNRVRELETELERRATEFGVLERLVGSLETALAVERQRVAELEGGRRAAGEPANAHSPSRAAVAQGAAPAVAHAGARGDAPPQDAGPLYTESIGEGVARLLIQSDGEREVVHVLGRKTSIGRTPDNDVQIEGRHISRHHAVILAGPRTTLIEDLNSTNGVLVNGRRVVREVLRDGDQVTIGRTLYRFALRRAGELR